MILLVDLLGVVVVAQAPWVVMAVPISRLEVMGETVVPRTLQGY
jgi:hypothetical protein